MLIEFIHETTTLSSFPPPPLVPSEKRKPADRSRQRQREREHTFDSPQVVTFPFSLGGKFVWGRAHQPSNPISDLEGKKFLLPPTQPVMGGGRILLPPLLPPTCLFPSALHPRRVSKVLGQQKLEEGDALVSQPSIQALPHSAFVFFDYSLSIQF